MFPLFVRYVLFILAAIGLLTALPDLWNSAMSDHAHANRHLGGWAVAFSIGLLVAAVQPARARGLLPMAFALGGVMIASAVFDILGGHTPGMAESTHVLEFLELVLLWVLARQQPSGRMPRGTRRADDGSPTRTAAPRLRVVRPSMFVTARARAADRHAA